MLYIIAGLIALCAYLLGSINTSIILSKAFFGQDIRTSGSGNAGATNMLRTHGKKMAVALTLRRLTHRLTFLLLFCACAAHL